MNKKRIILILIIVLISLSCLSVVNAGLTGNTINVKGIDFNIPGGWKEGDLAFSVYDTYDAKTVQYQGEIDKTTRIFITVAEKSPSGHSLSLSDADIPDSHTNLKNTTIAGKTGMTYDDSGMYDGGGPGTESKFQEIHGFVYMDHGKLVDIRIPRDMSFEEIIK